MSRILLCFVGLIIVVVSADDLTKPTISDNYDRFDLEEDILNDKNMSIGEIDDKVGVIPEFHPSPPGGNNSSSGELPPPYVIGQPDAGMKNDTVMETTTRATFIMKIPTNGTTTNPFSKNKTSSSNSKETTMDMMQNDETVTLKTGVVHATMPPKGMMGDSPMDTTKSPMMDSKTTTSQLVGSSNSTVKTTMSPPMAVASAAFASPSIIFALLSVLGAKLC